MKTVEVFIEKLNTKIQYKIGTNAEENFKLIDESKEDDLWFHVHNHPSCHVVANITQKYPRDELIYIIKQGACICKKNSKFASTDKLTIIYSKIKDIKKTDIVGTVTTNEKARLIYI